MIVSSFYLCNTTIIIIRSSTFIIKFILIIFHEIYNDDGKTNKICRYDINGFVEDLPPLLENRFRHACAALPDTGVSPTNKLINLQAFIVVGGNRDGFGSLSSVETFLPGAAAWTPLLASLPRVLYDAQASIVGGRLRVNGGNGGGSYRSEVMMVNDDAFYRSQVMMVQCTLPLMPMFIYI